VQARAHDPRGANDALLDARVGVTDHQRVEAGTRRSRGGSVARTSVISVPSLDGEGWGTVGGYEEPATCTAATGVDMTSHDAPLPDVRP